MQFYVSCDAMIGYFVRATLKFGQDVANRRKI